MAEVSFAVADAYLVTAAAAGHVRHVGDHAYSAGRYVDPISLSRQCLIEHAPPVLLADIGPLGAALRQAFPDTDTLVVRATADAVVDDRLQPLITYVRFAGPAGSGPAGPPGPPLPAGLALGQDTRDDDAVRGWLVTALAAGNRSRGRPVDEDRLAEAADAVLATPGRQSIVLRAGTAAIGHATMLCDQVDEVSGQAYVELFDSLVDDDAARRPGLAALVRACAAVAAERNLPLIGNVIHPSDSAGFDHSRRVLARLVATGWRPEYVYYECPWSAVGGRP
ncbi:hypothetical protein GCM10010124_06230 [Pilimelia terevasa]|uniref:Uncharacterized protein n=1 Tax=Pilimelia terevasa TaxID=53372 RepID=A0A8J3BKX0_9ACTN|nr:hypothetical protein [Pilimelia terevasa]GGK16385.1 hypothetical protein GCM10010124_06230 [Pilimelia terevasa]